jgi:hypothetical protein
MGGRIVQSAFKGLGGSRRASAIAGPGHMYEWDKGYLTQQEQYEQLKEQGAQVRETTKRSGLMGAGPEVTTYQRLTKRPEGGEVWTEIPKHDVPQPVTGPAYPQGGWKIVRSSASATRYGGGYRAKTGMGTRATRKTLMGGGTKRQQYDYRS